MKRRRKIVQAGSIADDLVRRMDPGGERYRSRVIAAWPSIAGAEVEAHTRGYAMREGELTVFVDSPIWATELSLMAAEYKTRLNEAVGQEAVSAVCFRVSTKPARASELDTETDAPEPSAAVRLEPLGDEERDRIARAADQIEDDELRAAALRAMTRRAEREKGSGRPTGTGSEE